MPAVFDDGDPIAGAGVFQHADDVVDRGVGALDDLAMAGVDRRLHRRSHPSLLRGQVARVAHAFDAVVGESE